MNRRLVGCRVERVCWCSWSKTSGRSQCVWLRCNRNPENQRTHRTLSSWNQQAHLVECVHRFPWLRSLVLDWIWLIRQAELSCAIPPFFRTRRRDVGALDTGLPKRAPRRWQPPASSADGSLQQADPFVESLPRPKFHLDLFSGSALSRPLVETRRNRAAKVPEYRLLSLHQPWHGGMRPSLPF